MSIFLFRLAGGIARRRGTVLAIWFLLLVAAVGGAGALGDRYDDSVAIPGTESQQGQDVLSDRFGLTGANGQMLLTATTGAITDKANSATVAQIVKKTDNVSGVSVSNPLTADDPVGLEGQGLDHRAAAVHRQGALGAHARRRDRRGEAAEGVQRHHVGGR